MQRLTKFFRGVSREMKKVSWPKQKELTRYTITVVVTVLIVAIFFAVIDTGLSALMRFLIN